MIGVVELFQSFAVLGQQQIEKLNNRISLRLEFKLAQRLGMIDESLHDPLCSAFIPLAKILQSHQGLRRRSYALDIPFQPSKDKVTKEVSFLSRKYFRWQRVQNLGQVRDRLCPKRSIVLVVDIRFKAGDQIYQLGFLRL